MQQSHPEYGNDSQKAISAIADALGAALAHHTQFHPDYVQDSSNLCIEVTSHTNGELSIQLPRYRPTLTLTEALTSNNDGFVIVNSLDQKFYEDLGRCFAMSYFLEDVDGTTANTLLKRDNENKLIGCRRLDYGCALASLQSQVSVISQRLEWLSAERIGLTPDNDVYEIIFYYFKILLKGADEQLFQKKIIDNFSNYFLDNFELIKRGFLAQLQKIKSFLGEKFTSNVVDIRRVLDLSELAGPDYDYKNNIDQINEFIVQRLIYVQRILDQADAGPSTHPAPAVLTTATTITAPHQPSAPSPVRLFARPSAKPYLLTGACCLALGAAVLALSMTGLLPAVLLATALTVLVVKIAAGVLMGIGGIGLAVGVKRLCA